MTNLAQLTEGRRKKEEGRLITNTSCSPCPIPGLRFAPCHIPRLNAPFPTINYGQLSVVSW
ncbi:MAG: hypothetical protein MUE44_32565 [Oscillatoriaceae cyanobacterium Prado104]|nr:hypothetical protein [Oscillatoriaceae cyanobacterium Prado104]